MPCLSSRTPPRGFDALKEPLVLTLLFSDLLVQAIDLSQAALAHPETVLQPPSSSISTTNNQ